jgi:hypothetical protein
MAEEFWATLALIDSPIDQAFQVLLRRLSQEKFREAVLNVATIPGSSLFEDPWCRASILLALTPFAREPLVALYAMQTLEEPKFQDGGDQGSRAVIDSAKGLLVAKVQGIRVAWNDVSLVPEG